jgi:hypothetical protein
LKFLFDFSPSSHHIILKISVLLGNIGYQMLKFLWDVSLQAEVNKMTPNNLGIVFSPNVLQPPPDADLFRQFEVSLIFNFT